MPRAFCHWQPWIAPWDGKVATYKNITFELTELIQPRDRQEAARQGFQARLSLNQTKL